MSQLKKIFIFKFSIFLLFIMILIFVPFYKLKMNMFMEKVAQTENNFSFFRERDKDSNSILHLKSKYQSRDWKFTGRLCQSTTNKIRILYAESIETKGCRIKNGIWFFPYLGKSSDLIPIDGRKVYINVDHIIPRAYAFQYGGFQWTNEQRIKFSNDFDELLPTNPNENLAKSSMGPYDWNVPNNPDFKYPYLRKWLFIAQKYENYPLILPQNDRNYIKTEIKKLIGHYFVIQDDKQEQLPMDKKYSIDHYTIGKNLKFFASILGGFNLWS